LLRRKRINQQADAEQPDKREQANFQTHMRTSSHSETIQTSSAFSSTMIQEALKHSVANRQSADDGTARNTTGTFPRQAEFRSPSPVRPDELSSQS
jgi:hypothetical protein